MRDWIFLFLGLVLAYSLEFTRPWVISWWKKRNLTVRERKIDNIKSRYKLLKEITESTTGLIVTGFRFLIVAIIFLSVVAISIGISILFPRLFGPNWIFIPLLAFGIGGIYASNDFLTILHDASYFEEYKKKTIKKLEKLGATLEEVLNE